MEKEGPLILEEPRSRECVVALDGGGGETNIVRLELAINFSSPLKSLKNYQFSYVSPTWQKHCLYFVSEFKIGIDTSNESNKNENITLTLIVH